jgi:hypothetical protein
MHHSRWLTRHKAELAELSSAANLLISTVRIVAAHFAETFEGNDWKSNPKVAYEGRQGTLRNNFKPSSRNKT